MDASTSSEIQVSTISKNCEKQDDNIKIGFDLKISPISRYVLLT